MQQIGENFVQYLNSGRSASKSIGKLTFAYYKSDVSSKNLSGFVSLTWKL